MKRVEITSSRKDILSYIRESISNKSQIRIKLKDEKGHREGEPHFFGRLKGTKNPALRILLTKTVRGATKLTKDEVDNFRIILLDDIEDADKMSKSFEPHKEYNPEDKDFLSYDTRL